MDQSIKLGWISFWLLNDFLPSFTLPQDAEHNTDHGSPPLLHPTLTPLAIFCVPSRCLQPSISQTFPTFASRSHKDDTWKLHDPSGAYVLFYARCLDTDLGTDSAGDATYPEVPSNDEQEQQQRQDFEEAFQQFNPEGAKR
ncbi:polysaccharide lyase family 4 protein [Apiospora arundinis]|uniref:Uncharacterized protein n=1 Tax=Apiospora arundinis TaxID=335852 RepID=A0ABR2J5C9_9PEZI